MFRFYLTASAFSVCSESVVPFSEIPPTIYRRQSKCSMHCCAGLTVELGEVCVAREMLVFTSLNEQANHRPRT